ncbi:MAG: alpha-glucosidase C-terminal domain-containing protein, partial [Bacillota bacterium]|nr:alpha-glucosidase C-terminal domain-containing protein [Bacillota bacterium]
HMMQGTPYIYQGEELGMTNVRFENINEYKDIETLNMFAQRLEKEYPLTSIMDSIYKIGRDNARTPMQWNSDKHAGFTSGPPWINVNPNYQDINVRSQLEKTDSVLNYYRQLVFLRKQSEWSEIIREGKFRIIEENHPDIFAYERFTDTQSIIVVCNFRGTISKFEVEHDLSDYSIVLSNYPDFSKSSGINLRPYESVVLGKHLVSM